MEENKLVMRASERPKSAVKAGERKGGRGRGAVSGLKLNRDAS